MSCEHLKDGRCQAFRGATAQHCAGCISPGSAADKSAKAERLVRAVASGALTPAQAEALAATWELQLD